MTTPASSIEWQVTRLARSDATTAFAIYRAAFDAEAGQPWTERDMGELLVSPGVHGELLRDRETPRGLVLWRIAADEAEILTLAVFPPCRRQGGARLLLGTVFDRARELGAAMVFLEVAADNRPAISLYARLGFDKVGLRKSYYSGNNSQSSDALVMRHDLTR